MADANENSLAVYPRYELNPLIAGIALKTRKGNAMIARHELQSTDKDTGEVSGEDILFIGIQKRVDQEEFVKIYRAQIQVIFELSRTGMKVFGYFMSAARINEDTVLFILDDCLKYCKFKSKQSAYDGLAELLKNEFIARAKTPNLYFINPKIFFNGKRIRIVQDYYLKSKREMKDPGQFDMLTGMTNAQMELEQKKQNP
jgi:hypothetical protein